MADCVRRSPTIALAAPASNRVRNASLVRPAQVLIFGVCSPIFYSSLRLLMEMHLLLEQLVTQWRARAEESRAAGVARADVYDICAAQLADVLRQHQELIIRDQESLDLFESRHRNIA